MTSETLRAALGGMADYPRFFVWRMVWDDTKQKFRKLPARPDGRLEYTKTGEPQGINHTDPANWLPFDTASAAVHELNARNDGWVYTLGWLLKADTGYWFFDLDHCIDPETRMPTRAATAFLARFPGAAIEYSSSGTGLHVFGRGPAPQHSVKNTGLGLEFYTDMRGVAFGMSGHAVGCADTRHDAAVAALVAEYFPPVDDAASEPGEWFEGVPRDDWRGPDDDAELLRRALSSRSLVGQYQGRASFADLWHRNAPVLSTTYPGDGPDGIGESEADAALAQHLAFWTGCDGERIERMMRQSALARDKWDDHRTYLREFTITAACNRQGDVYQERETVPAAVATVTDATVVDLEAIIRQVMNADETELRNTVIPEIRDNLAIERLDREKLALLIRDRFKNVFMIPVSLADCRALLRRKLTHAEQYEGVPEWANQHVYVLGEDKFFSLANGMQMTRTGFNALYNRLMPVKDNGDRIEAAKSCLERWNMTTVDDLMYAPGQELVFNYGGMTYANLYSESAIPDTAPGYTPAGLAGIEAFKRNLWALSGGREEIYYGLLAWMCSIVQRPDVKIRFVPLIKGVQGDGKSIILDAVTAAIGMRNVRRLSTELISSTSGFSGWAQGSQVSGIEEIRMSGRDRYRVYDSIKQYISNKIVTVHPKGGEARDVMNFTSYIAFTNYSDAAPLSDDDRRWWVIFSPFNRFTDLGAALGLDAAGVTAHFKAIHDSLTMCPGEWRRWLLELPIPEWFDPNGHAPDTIEKLAMANAGMDEIEMIARDIVKQGMFGVSDKVVSSSCLSNALRGLSMSEGVELPRTSGINHLMTRMGFISIGPVWWEGKTHRVWLRNDQAQNTENIKKLLNSTRITS